MPSRDAASSVALRILAISSMLSSSLICSGPTGKPADVAARSSETGWTPSASIVRPSLIWVPITREV